MQYSTTVAPLLTALGTIIVDAEYFTWTRFVLHRTRPPTPLSPSLLWLCWLYVADSSVSCFQFHKSTRSIVPLPILSFDTPYPPARAFCGKFPRLCVSVEFVYLSNNIFHDASAWEVRYPGVASQCCPPHVRLLAPPPHAHDCFTVTSQVSCSCISVPRVDGWVAVFLLVRADAWAVMLFLLSSAL